VAPRAGLDNTVFQSVRFASWSLYRLGCPGFAVVVTLANRATVCFAVRVEDITFMLGVVMVRVIMYHCAKERERPTYRLKIICILHVTYSMEQSPS
jgi:hypothetical protein